MLHLVWKLFEPIFLLTKGNTPVPPPSDVRITNANVDRMTNTGVFRVTNM